MPGGVKMMCEVRRFTQKIITSLISLVLAYGLIIPGHAETGLQMDKTEVSIGQFAEFAKATGFVSAAEQQGGMVYETGWTVKPGWNWRQPHGFAGQSEEPAVHLTFSEAEAYCRWRGKRLPTRQEWIDAAYTEHRNTPSDGFVTGQTYRYPTGTTPSGANCLSACGAETALKEKKQPVSHLLARGTGHVPVGVSKRGVNGLYDMGANVWEWARINEGSGAQATMGGSWWYGARQMEAGYGATKPPDMAVLYIGFRCIG